MNKEYDTRRKTAPPSPTQNVGGLQQVDNPSRYMTATYIISLGLIAVLSVVVHLLLDRSIERNVDAGKVINITGQQRMLTQRSALYVMKYHQTTLAEDSNQAIKYKDKLLDNVEFLIGEQGQSLSDELQNMYFEEPYNGAKVTREYASLINSFVLLEAGTLTNAQACTTPINCLILVCVTNEHLA